MIRLWLLFLPTFAALALLLCLFAKTGAILVDLKAFFDNQPVPGFWILPIKYGVAAVVMIATLWVRERLILRDVNICNAASVRREGANLSYHFIDENGDYFGGSEPQYQINLPRELAFLVLYDRTDPSRNAIVCGLMFHRLEVVGRGLTDLDAETSATHSRPLEATGN